MKLKTSIEITRLSSLYFSSVFCLQNWTILQLTNFIYNKAYMDIYRGYPFLVNTTRNFTHITVITWKKNFLFKSLYAIAFPRGKLIISLSKADICAEYPWRLNLELVSTRRKQAEAIFFQVSHWTEQLRPFGITYFDWYRKTSCRYLLWMSKLT